jgi:hypothetical protein
MPHSELHAFVGNTDCGSDGWGPSVYTGTMNDQTSHEELIEADREALEGFQGQLGLDNTRIENYPGLNRTILFVGDKPFLAFLRESRPKSS